MSASREKKNRQDRNASGYIDPKTARQAEELRKEKRTNRMYLAVGVLFVLVAVLLVVWNSGVLQRSATALTVDGEKYSAAEVNYYYNARKNAILNTGYASYYGLDTNTPLDQQDMNDMAKMLCGVSEDMTWDAYLKQEAAKNLTSIVMTCKDAEKNDFTFTDEMQQQLNDTLDSLADNAKQNGYSTNAFLKALYGNTMTMSTFKKVLRDNILADAYGKAYSDSLTYSDEDIAAYYADNKSSFDVANYEYIYFNGTAPSSTDDDGNTVPPTDEESAAATAAAKTAADAAMARYQAGDSLSTIADEAGDTASYSNREGATNSGDTVSTWVFDAARQAGDAAILDDGTNYYLVVFHSVGRNEYNTVDVRHILFKVDTESLDPQSETYDKELQIRKDAAQSKAEDALAQWTANGGTEDAFAALANELSEDPGSNTNGGLYEKIYKGEMVPEFNDWCFDPARQAGDTGIVFNENTGCHVIYFVGTNDPYWKVQVTQTLQNKDLSDWNAALVADVTTAEGSGMKYVG